MQSNISSPGSVLALAGGRDVITTISSGLQRSGRDIRSLRASELSAVDQFHIRGPKATLELAQQMETLLSQAGFRVHEVHDSTDESQRWFEAMTDRMAQSGPPPVTIETIPGEDFKTMAKNQIRNLRERRIRTVSYVCEG